MTLIWATTIIMCCDRHRTHPLARLEGQKTNRTGHNRTFHPVLPSPSVAIPLRCWDNSPYRLTSRLSSEQTMVTTTTTMMMMIVVVVVESMIVVLRRVVLDPSLLTNPIINVADVKTRYLRILSTRMIQMFLPIHSESRTRERDVKTLHRNDVLPRNTTDVGIIIKSFRMVPSWSVVLVAPTNYAQRPIMVDVVPINKPTWYPRVLVVGYIILLIIKQVHQSVVRHRNTIVGHCAPAVSNNNNIIIHCTEVGKPILK
mmetsp:Transcript_1088/g.1989  ORF Transcript_1088/g.1989 Transcript_1088/m.1989 type:complete len:257 (+) Transcript_1088:568-1338(+)